MAKKAKKKRAVAKKGVDGFKEIRVLVHETAEHLVKVALKDCKGNGVHARMSIWEAARMLKEGN